MTSRKKMECFFKLYFTPLCQMAEATSQVHFFWTDDDKKRWFLDMNNGVKSFFKEHSYFHAFLVQGLFLWFLSYQIKKTSCWWFRLLLYISGWFHPQLKTAWQVPQPRQILLKLGRFYMSSYCKCSAIIILWYCSRSPLLVVSVVYG